MRVAENRPLSLRLLGGLVVFVTTLFCAPLRRTGKGRGKEGGGLYPEWSVLGIVKGDSPALISEVARSCALLPSYEIARREIARRGPDLDIKVVHRIARQLGARMLETRRRDLALWRKGLLPAGTELAGKRIGVQIDGGRTRLRERRRRQKGRGKNKTQRRSYKPAWREPKAIIIFELDEKGRMKRGTRPWMDATFDGPDETMELVAFHLHRLGAAQAETVAFASDGAPWIWDRLDDTIRRAGLDINKTHRILDWCHAVHHVSTALEALNLPADMRTEHMRRLRRLLRAGRPCQAASELEALGKGSRSEVLKREIAYLRKHASHMCYSLHRRAGLPMGSGAIESTIRRLINLRLKGNGIMWVEANAEGMLALRAAALCDRWDETLEHVRATMAADRRIGRPEPSPGASGASNPPVSAVGGLPIPLAPQGVSAIPA